jgi:hypothetical protein
MLSTISWAEEQIVGDLMHASRKSGGSATTTCMPHSQGLQPSLTCMSVQTALPSPDLLLQHPRYQYNTWQHCQKRRHMSRAMRHCLYIPAQCGTATHTHTNLRKVLHTLLQPVKARRCQHNQQLTHVFMYRNCSSAM